MKHHTLIAIVICIVSSCEESKITREDYTQLERQVTLNGKYNIYQFSRMGAMAFSSDISGLRLFKKNEVFSESKGHSINGHIGSWLSKDTLELIRFTETLEQPKDTIAEVSYEKLLDLTFKVKTYRSVNSSSMIEYYFQDFKIQNNKIQFSQIETKLGLPLSKEIVFSLGNIKMVSAKDTLSNFIISTVKTSMNFTYHNADSTITKNLPEVGFLEIYLYPRHKIKIDSSEIKGIFRSL